MREDISLKQAFSMLFIFLTGGIMAVGGGSESGRDSYIAAIVCIIFVVPLFYVYYKPFLIDENSNFFEIIDLSYGKSIGNLINIIYGLSVLLVAVVSFSRFTIFIKTVALENTSLYIIGLFMAITCIFATYSGFEVLARFCEIMIIAIVFCLALFMVVSFDLFNIYNVQPFIENGYITIFEGSFSLASTPFMESFALIMLISQNRKRKDMQKVIIMSAIASAITIAIVFLRNLLILGYPAIESLYYPSYLAISLVSIGEFFERQEVAVSIVFLIADIVKITSLSIFLCKMINYKVKTKEYKYYSFAIIMFIFALSGIFFANTMQLFRFFSVYKYILVVPFGILPIITLILCKKRLK